MVWASIPLKALRTLWAQRDSGMWGKASLETLECRLLVSNIKP